ncbi:MAG: hypothetical protein H7Z41_17660 [Cytophagales bacterium]|nr:hypothetical protein [Armatimonadota bacterium]
MTLAILLLTTIHVGAGLLCLLLGPVALIVTKGSPAHRRTGRLYLRLMVVMALTAFTLLFFRFDSFFFVLAVFSYYLAFSGYRVLRRKRPDRDQPASALDWAVALFTLGAGIVSLLLHAQGRLVGDPAFVVSLLGGTMLVAVYDLARFSRPPDSRLQPQVWLFEHLTKLIGSYIAIVSAFSATTMKFLPEPLRQFWPVALGLPLMLGFVLHYRHRFAQSKMRSGKKPGATPLPE